MKTVKQLIAELQRLDSSLPVMTHDVSYGWNDEPEAYLDDKQTYVPRTQSFRTDKIVRID